MSLLQRVEDTYYPESDGRPMGETDVHIEWTIRIRDILKYRYRDQRVYVASNLLVYYQQGEPYKFVVPDDFVVLECDAGPRRTFKTWEEEKSPDVVFEVTSRSTRRYADLCFQRAFPVSSADHRLVVAELDGSGVRDEPVYYQFSFDVARWLARRACPSF